MDRFDRTTFESIEFLIESTEAPKIKAGGSSSSNILNRYFSALGQDVSLLATRTNILAVRADRVSKACAQQGGALEAMFTSLSARVDAASSYSTVLADMHSNFYIDNGAENNVDFSYVFGQATLAQLSSTNLLVQSDVYGNSYVSPETQFMYSTSNASSVSDTSITDFQPDIDGLFMLKGMQTWLKDVQPGQAKGYIRIKAPLQFKGLTPNVIEIWPLPAFGMTINKVSYLDSTGGPTWTHCDLSYLPNYNGATQQIDTAGPIRLHLPNPTITELVIEFGVAGLDVWGVKAINVYHREYASNGTLVVEDPYSRTVGSVTLRGKDPSVLSTFSTTKVGNKATITLSSTDSATTPVLTGVLFDVT